MKVSILEASQFDAPVRTPGDPSEMDRIEDDMSANLEPVQADLDGDASSSGSDNLFHLKEFLQRRKKLKPTSPLLKKRQRSIAIYEAIEELKNPAAYRGSFLDKYV